MMSVSKVCVEAGWSTLDLTGTVVCSECPCGAGEAGDSSTCVSSCRLVKVGSTVPKAHVRPVKEFTLLEVAVSCCTNDGLPALVEVIAEDLLSENVAAILGYGVLLYCCISSPVNVRILIVFSFFFLVGCSS